MNPGRSASIFLTPYNWNVCQVANVIAEEDAELNSRLAQFGAEIILPNSNILTHCNTG